MAFDPLEAAKEILASLGNTSPDPTQVTALSQWIYAEKGNQIGDQAVNNPLNISVNGTPSAFNPQPTSIQPSNPIAAFGDFASGVGATAQRLTQPFASGILALLRTPQTISAGQLSAAVSASGWGTAPFGASHNGTSPTSVGIALPRTQITVPILSGIGSGAQSAAQAAVSAAEAPLAPVGDFFKKIGNVASFVGDPHNWWKVLFALAGVALIVVGLIMFVSGDKNVQQAAAVAGKAAVLA